jgi:hypothetical protein
MAPCRTAQTARPDFFRPTLSALVMVLTQLASVAPAAAARPRLFLPVVLLVSSSRPVASCAQRRGVAV